MMVCSLTQSQTSSSGVLGKVKFILGSITTNKASGCDGIPAERFQILKDAAAKVQHSICQQIWKTQQKPQDWKRSVFIPIQRREMPENFQITIQLCLFHMLVRLCSKSFKLNFSSTWTENGHMYELDLEKAEEQEVQLPTSVGSQKKAREFQKNIYFCFIDYPKAYHCVDHKKMWIILKQIYTRPPEKPVLGSRSNS